jgi:hypothetical protein
MQTREEDKRITRYLLGRLTEDEQTALEQEYFADPEKFEEIWAAENELVDAYVRGRLSREERDLFERHYMQSPKHRERVAVARKLVEAADRPAPGGAASPTVESSTAWWSNLMEFLSTSQGLRLGLAAAAMLLMFAGIAWLAVERMRLDQELGNTKAQLSEQQRRQQEIANQLAAEREQRGKLKSELEQLQQTIAQRQSQTPEQPRRASILSFILSPMLVRSGGEPQQITITRETDLVRLQMKIEDGDRRRFQATIRTVEGKQIWSQRSIKPAGGKVEISIPANRLPTGDYILTLSATGDAGESEEINRYFFRVSRK